mmetsp:Transcript_66087/g.103195  ORF Transcript_66087/g.103195 Transcript_66087/m.103195 type:complete len:462 (+) Transcript_66087:125-1510(+)
MPQSAIRNWQIARSLSTSAVSRSIQQASTRAPSRRATSSRNSARGDPLDNSRHGHSRQLQSSSSSGTKAVQRSTSVPALRTDEPDVCAVKREPLECSNSCRVNIELRRASTEYEVDACAVKGDPGECSNGDKDRRELRRAFTDSPCRKRPWRKSNSEVNAERIEAERILQVGSDAADAAGIDVRGLLVCMVAQECLDSLAVPKDSLAAAQAAVDGLRQSSTNAALKEDVESSRDAVIAAFQSIGLAEELKSRLRRPSAGKYDNCDMVLPGLWIGGWTALNNDAEELRRHKVTHVVSVMSTESRTELPSFIRGHHHIMANDNEDAAADLYVHFPAVCRFVDAARNEPRGCVYIHCGIGVSRAPTVTASYIMWKLGLPAVAALALIRQARPKIRPNLGFVKQLKQWEVDRLELPGGGQLSFNHSHVEEKNAEILARTGTKSTSASSESLVSNTQATTDLAAVP